MTYVCAKWLKYLRNGKTLWEMTQIYGKSIKYVGKWLKYLTNGLRMWKMNWRFWIWLKYLGNGLDTWGTA